MRKLAILVILAGLVGVAACSTAAQHQVSQRQRVDRYVHLVHAAFGPVGDGLTRHDLVANGRVYCRALRTGTYTYPRLLRKTVTALSSELDARQSKVSLDLALVTFCPDQTP